MEKQITGKEIAEDMEHLVKLLHKEWERSGRTKALVTIRLSDAAEVKKRMAKVIAGKQKQLENDELTFRQSMELSKQNFVLLRLVKKVKKAEWTCFADMKQIFGSVDSVGNQHYVFNIRGNNHRLIVVVKFTIKLVLVRFIGTHAEYDLIDAKNI